MGSGPLGQVFRAASMRHLCGIYEANRLTGIGDLCFKVFFVFCGTHKAPMHTNARIHLFVVQRERKGDLLLEKTSSYTVYTHMHKLVSMCGTSELVRFVGDVPSKA